MNFCQKCQVHPVVARVAGCALCGVCAAQAGHKYGVGAITWENVKDWTTQALIDAAVLSAIAGQAGAPAPSTYAGFGAGDVAEVVAPVPTFFGKWLGSSDTAKQAANQARQAGGLVDETKKTVSMAKWVILGGAVLGAGLLLYITKKQAENATGAIQALAGNPEVKHALIMG